MDQTRRKKTLAGPLSEEIKRRTFCYCRNRKTKTVGWLTRGKQGGNETDIKKSDKQTDNVLIRPKVSYRQRQDFRHKNTKVLVMYL